jgi:hypothetical protein
MQQPRDAAVSEVRPGLWSSTTRHLVSRPLRSVAAAPCRLPRGARAKCCCGSKFPELCLLLLGYRDHRFEALFCLSGTLLGLGEQHLGLQPKQLVRTTGGRGNICTEELVLLCEAMGIDTGVDLDALIEVGCMAEEIVGHQTSHSRTLQRP